ncbi:divalent-cation tolerance protein CutA [Microcoleus sp. FACHB-1515]|uniref:divalent-cation tolerance protein CutA n=1 Tax=Cyanophyceae TaxID=3028117 RepID=UPI001688A93C|nr:divalent-cation tolerance protein CutA [Microcoleus sp. FACHB-1515]MBD2088497.1 divalent-cation tolerance protein CutA [Microcoleus sp. FACHB-1515]
MSSAQLGVVLVTAASELEAKTIAQSLIATKLAACVSIWPVRSIYTWQGELEDSQEWQLLIKTDLNQFAQLEAKVRSLHAYDLPEIIALPIAAGSAAYLDWLQTQTQPSIE